MLVLIEFSVDVSILVIMLAAAALIGYLPRTAKLRKAQRTIDRLEKEMLANHAEILSLQKEMNVRNNQSSRTPIVPIRENGGETKKETLPEPAVRKKVVSGGSAGNQ